MPSATRRHVAFLALLALAASCTSLGNGFALDDLPIIVRNERVHALVAPWTWFGQTYWPPEQGPALYRPLAILAYALQWAAGGGSPFVFHLTSVLLYLLATLAVYWLARHCVAPAFAFVVAGLFAVHPVHVEAVGNVVGQSEIVVGALVALAVGWYVRARGAGALGVRQAAPVAAWFGIALCFKEHAVMLPVLVVLAELLLVEEQVTLRVRFERLLPVLLGLVTVLVAFWTVRTMVTGGLVGRDILPVFRAGDPGTRLLTALGVMPEYVRLLLFPVHLSADYNPEQIPILHQFNTRAFDGLVVLALVAAALVWSWRRHPVVAFGICWTVITLLPVSNILLPTGVLLAERTLFLPSVGAMLAVTGLLATVLPAPEPRPAGRARVAWSVAAVVVCLGLIRSALRQPVWRDNATLFAQTAQDAPRSYKALAAHAVMLLEAGEDEAGEREYRQALELYRDDPNMFADLGDWYLRKNRCHEALAMYQRVLELVPAHWAATSRTILCLTRVGRLTEARRMAEVAVRRGDEGAAAKLAYVDSVIAAQGRPVTR